MQKGSPTQNMGDNNRSIAVLNARGYPVISAVTIYQRSKTLALFETKNALYPLAPAQMYNCFTNNWILAPNAFSVGGGKSKILKKLKQKMP